METNNLCPHLNGYVEFKLKVGENLYYVSSLNNLKQHYKKVECIEVLFNTKLNSASSHGKKKCKAFFKFRGFYIRR